VRPKSKAEIDKPQETTSVSSLESKNNTDGDFECSFECYDFKEDRLLSGKKYSDKQKIKISGYDRTSARSRNIAEDKATQWCKEIGYFKPQGYIDCVPIK
jgi:hypothetical protein